MSHLMDRVSYLRGLMDGMKLDTETNEGTLLSKIVDVLENMACEISELADAQQELSDYVEDVDQDLGALEDLFADEEDEDDEDEEEFVEDEIDECDGDCEGCSGCDDEEVDYDGDILVECMCPQCQGAFYVKEEELSDEAFHICPRCGARIHVVPDYEDDIPVAALADVEDKDE